MSGSRAKKLRKEYRKIADEVASGDIRDIMDRTRRELMRWRNLAIISFSMSAIMFLGIVFYAISI